MRYILEIDSSKYEIAKTYTVEIIEDCKGYYDKT